MLKSLRPAFTTYLFRINAISRYVTFRCACNHNHSIIRTSPINSHKHTLLGKTYTRKVIMLNTSIAKLTIKTIEVPSMGDSITEGTIVDLPVAPGDYVRADDVVVTLETDKVSVDVRAPEAGSIVEIMNEVDDIVQVGDNLFTIDTSKVDTELNITKPQPPVAVMGAATPSIPSTNSHFSSPSINDTEIPTTPFPTEEVKTHNQQKYPSASAFLGRRTERRVKMSRMRLRVAARLKDAQNTSAMLTTFQEVDMSKLMDMRTNYKEEFHSKHGVKLGFMSSFVKASTAALKEIAVVNSYIDDNTKEIVFRNYCDISVAVASPGGLVVPVLRNTETMTFADVERSIAMYSQKAKDGTLSLDDMAGGTFTISNGGVFGSLMGMPIINPPQSAILGMHATKMRAVVNKHGDVVPRPMMYLALTYDHRLIDGREGVTFLRSIAEKIKDPSHLLLDI